MIQMVKRMSKARKKERRWKSLMTVTLPAKHAGIARLLGEFLSQSTPKASRFSIRLVNACCPLLCATVCCSTCYQLPIAKLLVNAAVFRLRIRLAHGSLLADDLDGQSRWRFIPHGFHVDSICVSPFVSRSCRVPPKTVGSTPSLVAQRWRTHRVHVGWNRWSRNIRNK